MAGTLSWEEMVARCGWNEATRADLLERFIRETGALERLEAWVREAAAAELETLPADGS